MMQGVATLQDAAWLCLAADSVEAKLALTRAAAQWAQAHPGRQAAADSVARPLPMPGRPPRPRLVPPRELAQRGLGSVAGRAAFLHAIAHIEFNAIDLAWDAVYRFRGMPDDFYRDWIGVAVDEARHFSLLSARLDDLGHAYGDFDAHNGLWEMAVKTADSCLVRMALVPRVLEARGLDVTPAMIERLRQVGDEAAAAVLEVILREEVAHVAAGTRWFHWCCEREKLDPDHVFRDLLKTQARHVLKGPFNHPARRAAGFSAAELEQLAALAG
ncbi:MAG: ferritin-like domain-containing protein [Lysobacteraceae bacterium]